VRDVGAGHLAASTHAECAAVPYPKNPPPASLTMPDFSRSPGGFADGQFASNKAVYIAVLEEWNDCSVRLAIFTETAGH
jgi:hypothetical protein